MQHLKRDNWTNDEVIDILEGLKKTEKEGEEMCSWNLALEIAVAQFYDFKKDAGEFTAMAYDTTAKEILVVGPQLPR